jgi:hypothetical protein
VIPYNYISRVQALFTGLRTAGSQSPHGEHCSKYGVQQAQTKVPYATVPALHQQTADTHAIANTRPAQTGSEIADIINQAIGNQPGAGAFVKEFLDRKDKETARLANPGKKQKNKGQQGGNDWQAPSKPPAATKKAAAAVKGGVAGAAGKKGGRANGFAVLGMH